MRTMAYFKEKRPDILPYSAKTRRVTSAYRFVHFLRLRDFMLALQRNNMGNLFYL